MNAKLGFMPKRKINTLTETAEVLEIGDIPTKQMRFPMDLADMLVEISAGKKKSVAFICDSMFREAIAREYRACLREKLERLGN
jgi:hypothetical protein